MLMFYFVIFWFSRADVRKGVGGGGKAKCGQGGGRGPK